MEYARVNYNAVSLDRIGNMIFKTPKDGEEARKKLITQNYGELTIDKMIPKYAKSDYSGKAHP